jgi:serine/threonine-protein kinase
VFAIVRGRVSRLGSVAVDVRRSALIVDPISIAADPSGSLVVGQLRRGALLRVAGGRVTTLASGIGVYHVSTAGSDVYGAGRDGAVHRAENGALRRVSPVVDANAVVVDAAGNLYVSVYAGWVKKIAPDGTVSTLAGDGTEGFAGDGGPARAARLNHPHAIALGRDGALYVADTENRRVRRIDLGTGRISSFGGDVGVTVSVSVAPDGSVYSADLARNGRPGGVTRTSAAGVTRRVLSSFSANGVAVAPNGSVYVNFADERRIGRLDVSNGRVTPVARG